MGVTGGREGLGVTVGMIIIVGHRLKSVHA